MMSDKIRAPRNRTLTLDPRERQTYLSKSITCPKEITSIKEVVNQTILGNSMEVIKLIPDESFDLIILDPPYNLTKNFNGFKFENRTDALYLDYLRSWFPEVVRTLKNSGSVYLCGDWKCTSALHTIMSENLEVLNRITWQREKGRGAKSNWKNAMEDI